MRNLLAQLKRAGKHLKSIIQKLMNKLLNGASSSIKSVGDVVAYGLTCIGFIVLLAVILTMTLPSLMLLNAETRGCNGIVNDFQADKVNQQQVEM